MINSLLLFIFLLAFPLTKAACSKGDSESLINMNTLTKNIFRHKLTKNIDAHFQMSIYIFKKKKKN